MNRVANTVPPAADSQKVFEQASALHEAGKFTAAEALLRDAIAIDPGNVSLRNARGVMFAAMKRHLDAVWCYRDALACDPAAVGVWTNLGNSLTQLNHLKSAIACHRRAIAMSRGSDPLLHHNLGTSLAEAGQHGEAVIAFSHALKLDPTYHTAQWDQWAELICIWAIILRAGQTTKSARSRASYRCASCLARFGTGNLIRGSASCSSLNKASATCCGSLVISRGLRRLAGSLLSNAGRSLCR